MPSISSSLGCCPSDQSASFSSGLVTELSPFTSKSLIGAGCSSFGQRVGFIRTGECLASVFDGKLRGSCCGSCLETDTQSKRNPGRACCGCFRLPPKCKRQEPHRMNIGTTPDNQSSNNDTQCKHLSRITLKIWPISSCCSAVSSLSRLAACLDRDALPKSLPNIIHPTEPNPLLRLTPN